MKIVRRFALLLVCGLTAASCGGDDESSSAAPVDSGAAADASDASDASDAESIEAGDATPDADTEHQSQVEELTGPLLDDGWTIGMVVGLVRSDGVEYYGMGTTAPGGSEVPDANSVFEIGSISKTFTSLVLAELVEDGVVTLDQPVQELLPSEVQVPERNGKAITLRHLSTHHSGLPRLPDNFSPADISDPYIDYAPQDLYDFINGYALPRDPGASFEYSNLGAGLLGHALSLEAGLSFDELVRTRITEPMGLKDTTIALSSNQLARFVPGHDADGQAVPAWNFDVLAPAGALRSTATDMVAYVSAQSGLQSGPLDAAMAATHEQQYTIDTDLGIGLAWIIEEGRYVWHNGGTGGFGTFVGFDTQTKTGVTVLSNVQGIYTPETGLGRSLLRMMAGESYEPVELPPTLKMTAEDLSPYVGSFESTVGSQTFTVSFSVDADHLRATVPGSDPLTLYAMAEAEFYMRLAPVWVTFEGSGGQYDSFTLEQQGGTTITGTRIP